MGRAAARIEKLGIPTMVVTRSGFTQATGNAFAGLGFAPEAPSVYEFPLEMFDPVSDLTPIKENIDKIVYGLTKWEPKVKEKGVYPAEKVTVTGKDYDEAVANMNNLFLKNMWGDGLPILPPTEERVNWILTGTDLPRDKVIGKVVPRGGIVTPQTLAVNLAMAGGRPEYLPVLIAAMEVIINDPGITHWQITTGSSNPVVIVNGPIARQIRLNSGYGLLGPDPNHPAGGSIGRAIRFILQNLGGAIAGTGTMSLYGGVNRYTNLVFAEDEDGIPPGWKPLNVEQGFHQGSNTVTFGTSGSYSGIHFISLGEEKGIPITLSRYIQKIRGEFLGMGALGGKYTPDGVVGIGFIPRGVASALAQFGWTKEKVKAYLWENTKIPWSEIERAVNEAGPAVPPGFGSAKLIIEKNEWTKANLREGELWPISMSPDNIKLVVAGGEQSGHGFWVTTGKLYTTEIKLPANWDELLKQAEEDLGPIPGE